MGCSRSRWDSSKAKASPSGCEGQGRSMCGASFASCRTSGTRSRTLMGRGVVHRDIKPDNIMLERATGRALLMDFGISRSITAKVEGRGATQGLTRVGEVVRTAEYMSPEQASGDVVDGRSDLYSLGLVALFALTGRHGSPPSSGGAMEQRHK
jgi:serine/threonine protein kinase